MLRPAASANEMTNVMSRGVLMQLTSSHLILHIFFTPSLHAGTFLFITFCLPFTLYPDFSFNPRSPLIPLLFYWPFAFHLSNPLSLVLSVLSYSTWTARSRFPEPLSSSHKNTVKTEMLFLIFCSIYF